MYMEKKKDKNITKKNNYKLVFKKEIPALNLRKDILEKVTLITSKMNEFPEILDIKDNIVLIPYYKGLDGRILLFLPFSLRKIGKIMKKFHILGKIPYEDSKYVEKLKFYLEKVFVNLPAQLVDEYHLILNNLINHKNSYVTVLHNDFTFRNFLVTWQGFKIVDFEGFFHPKFPNPFFNFFDLGIFLLNLLSFYKFLPIFNKTYMKKSINQFLEGYNVDLFYAYSAFKIVGIFHYFGIFIDRPILKIYAHKRNFKVFKNILEDFLFKNKGILIEIFSK